MNKKLIFSNNTKINEAIKLLDENGNGILPVVNLSNELTGLITDGDIRKAILNEKLDLKYIINKNPYKLHINSSKNQIINYLKKIRRRHIPLVDNDNKFIKIFTLDEIEFNLKNNWIVIMAGGLGTRLGELTKNIPKPMLKIGNKPILQHIIEMFTSYGFTKFIISVNYKSEIIKNYFKDGNEFGIEVKYLEEKKRLGTGGALSLIDLDINEPFFVTNGDVITSLDFNEMLNEHLYSKANATMCVKKETYQLPYGNVSMDEEQNIIEMKEKPIYSFFINTGIYIFDPIILKYIPKNVFFDLPEVFELLKKDNKSTKTFIMDSYWVDIGKKEQYDLTSKKFKDFL
ncbi:MAG: nucleotidyltransferase family protein [Arcobacter sp.]|uniref:nucleotidyltransferase family protein n=1 Tax=Arcobacter sp. TaxID=1872629 RepID=UPI003B004C23